MHYCSTVLLRCMLQPVELKVVNADLQEPSVSISYLESGVAPPGNPLFFTATLLYKRFCNNWLPGALNMKLSPG